MAVYASLCVTTSFSEFFNYKRRNHLIMLKHLLLLATSIIIYTSSHGQKTLSGIVTDETTKQAVPGAVVYIPEFQRSTSTAPDGKYVFENIGNGVINIQVTSIGY